MTPNVVDPEWGWLIIWYFFLGGIAAGAYFLAALADIFGSNDDRNIWRAGYLLAAPLIAICGLLLIVDLNHPWRFWHMLLDVDSGRPHIKFWSPMSIGAWALLLFGAMTGISFIGTLTELRSQRWQAMARRWRRGTLGRAFAVVGIASGFFIA